MGKSISVSLEGHFEEFISEKLNKGSFDSPLSIVQEGLRLLELEDNKIENLNTALEAGKNSPMIKDFNPTSFLDYLNKKNA
ncbi:MAG: antitoxin [Cytophagaceae bacterium BCCC1]|nr:MAG: antitoxin [Cytophagaceae bacterium BCCC1]